MFGNFFRHQLGTLETVAVGDTAGRADSTVCVDMNMRSGVTLKHARKAHDPLVCSWHLRVPAVFAVEMHCGVDKAAAVASLPAREALDYSMDMQYFPRRRRREAN